MFASDAPIRPILLSSLALCLVLSSLPAAAQSVPCVAGFAGNYPCQNVDLLAVVPSGTLVAAGGNPSTGSDMWGWTDPETGREYAVQTLSDAVAFVDVTEPTAPVFVGYLPAPVTNFLWRDVKVYRDHAYIVGDFSPDTPLDSSPEVHGLQIFDLTELRGAAPSTVFAETALYLGFDEAHNLAINEETGFAYVGASDTCGGGLHMLDLEPDPADPQFVGCFDDGGINVHDSQCVVYRGPDPDHHGREICFNANESRLDIVDVTDKSAPVRLSSSTYEGMSYVHQGWLTEDHEYFALGDETDELFAAVDLMPHNTHTYLWDMRDLDNPVQLPTYVGPTAAIDHNIYIRGRFIYETNYTAGLRILDGADIANGNLEEIAFFDTHPADDATAFGGGWSSYPYFASRIVVVSNFEDGLLFVLQPHLPADDGDGEEGGKTTGGGWLATDDGGKIHFGYNARQIAEGPEGELQLNDKKAGVKLHMSDLVLIGSVEGDCGSVTASENALEFRGTGTFGDEAASFRVCVEDNDEPGHSRATGDPDLFYLECVAGCDYDTGSRGADDALDGGNLQVHEGAGGGETSTLILDPLLLSEGEVGAVQLFEVRAFDGSQEPAAGASVTLSKIAGGQLVETLSAVTGADGVARVSAVLGNQTGEYTATSGQAESNGVEVDPLSP